MTKVHQLFSPNVEGVVVDKLLFRFSICASIPEIFAIKVESCQKSRRILDDFLALPNFLGRSFPKFLPSLSLLPRGTSTKKFHVDTPTSPEVIEPNTLNFRPNCKFSRLKFLRDPRPPWGCALASLRQSLARVKI